MSDFQDLTGLKHDPSSLNLLEDPVKEAELFLRGRYVETVAITLADFVELVSSRLSKGSYLLSCRDDISYAILIEDGVIKSIVEYFETSIRIPGYMALRDFSRKLASSMIECRIFDLTAKQREGESGAQVSMQAGEVKGVQPVEPGGKSIETVKPVAQPAIDQDRLKGFVKHLRDIVSETAELYGCVMIDNISTDLSNEVLVVKVKLRKKGLFGKCRDSELKTNIEKDLPILKELHEVGLEVKIEFQLIG
ncbi:hypothetical protein [Desulfurococcus amylolyticus]|uniref:Uncharacterized protein n=1 Tax=Desulfurococcus amylolyticus DSM 16532 TaxID=768672 RepID=I3XQC4_DESAM|nr:hypothetical protein [Desulfurococcus amylolyticus]AFL66148.1 hypothetical protein Desfe_0237 [Desulfurococcus amylolyticus DSM 16532]